VWGDECLQFRIRRFVNDRVSGPRVKQLRSANLSSTLSRSVRKSDVWSKIALRSADVIRGE
jgi:hypothetical protein